LIVEVSETYPIHNIGALLYFARKCSALGGRITLDDCKIQHVFSSPWLVSWVRPDIIKIDGVLLCQRFEQQSVEPVTGDSGGSGCSNAIQDYFKIQVCQKGKFKPRPARSR